MNSANIKKSFFFHYFYCNFRSFFYIALSIIFPVLFSVNFFIRQQFFTGNGSTDLLLFFFAAPFFCIFEIPLLCFPQSFSVYDDFVPLKIYEKVLIVFCARVLLFLIQILLLFPAVLILNIYGSIDYGQFFACVLSLALYGICAISLCSFTEKLFLSKILYLIVSVSVLSVFNCAHLFAIYVPLPDFLQTFFKQISFAWHFDAAGKGIFDSRDFFWFIGITFLFLILSVLIQLKQKGKKFSESQKINNIALVFFSVLIVLNGNRWYKRIDFSKNKTYSISNYSQSLIQKIDEPLKITYYCSANLSKLYPQIRDVRDYLIDYAASSKKISFLVQNPDKSEKIRTLLQNYGIKPQQMRTVSNTSTNITNVYSAIILEYKGNVQIIPFCMEANSLEFDLAIRIKSLLSGSKRTVNIIVGNGMSLFEDYNYVVPYLSSQGFNCNPIYTDDPSFVSLLENASGLLLIIGDSQINIENAVAVENYILSEKGNALFAVSPYSVNIESDWAITSNKKTNIIEMLENWGVGFSQKIGADISCARITMISDDEFDSKNINYYLWPSLLSQKNALLGATVFWPVPLELSKNAESYFVSSNSGFYFDADNLSPNNLFQTNPFVIETLNLAEKEKSIQCFAAEIKGKISGLYNELSTQNARIIVISDQYFVNSLMTSYIGGETGDYRNFEVLSNALLKLNNEEELANIQSKIFRDVSLYKVSSNYDFAHKKNITYLILFCIFPLIVLIFGVLQNVKIKK